jgi:DNA-directed RNA polymerase subunit RPC12/RpoP
MSLPRRAPAYHCAQCGAAGELPAGDGDASCPNCGRPLEVERPGASKRFGPDPGLPVRSGRPELSLDGLWLARLCVLVFRPIVCLWVFLRQRKLEALVNAKLDEMAWCRGREELIRVIGEPLYAVGGKSCGAVLGDGTQESPDVIECYESEGCCIDLWFKDDRLVSVSGFVKPTVWDFVLAGGNEGS